MESYLIHSLKIVETV